MNGRSESFDRGANPKNRDLRVSKDTQMLEADRPRRDGSRQRFEDARDWRTWVAAIGLTASAGTGAGLLADGGMGGYLPLRAIVCLVGLVLAAANSRQVARVAKSNLAVFLFVAWSVTSLIWSRSPMDTLTTLAGLGGVVVFALALAVMGRNVRVDLLILWVFTVTTVVSYALIFAAPGVGTVTVDHPTEGTLAQPIGIFIWNSDLGFSAAIGSIVAIFAYVSGAGRRNWVWLPVAALQLGMVWLSNSATSVIVLVAGLAVLVLTAGRRVTLPILGAGLVGVVGGLIVLGPAGLLDRIFGLLGRSATLTGRVDLWESTLLQAQDTPLLGKGAGVEPSFAGLSNANHSHNGFVQIYFDRGAVGLILIVAVILFACIHSLRRRDWMGLSIVVMVVTANIANDYLSFASLGLLLLMWQAYNQAPGERGPRLTKSSFERFSKGRGQIDCKR